MSIFMKFGEITGESTDQGHENWMNVSGISFAVKRKITSNSSTRNNRESATTEITDLETVRRMDSASPALFLEACCGTGKDVIVHMTKTGSGSGGEVFAEYILKNALLSKYQVHAASQDSRHPLETLTISFIGMEVKYIPFDDDGEPQAPVSVAYDTSTHTKR